MFPKDHPRNAKGLKVQESSNDLSVLHYVMNILKNWEYGEP